MNSSLGNFSWEFWFRNLVLGILEFLLVFILGILDFICEFMLRNSRFRNSRIPMSL